MGLIDGNEGKAEKAAVENDGDAVGLLLKNIL